MWPFDIKAKRRRAESAAASAEWTNWQAVCRNKGYRHWIDNPPPRKTWIEATRREWASKQVWLCGNENPEMNISGLWWRPWQGETISGTVLDEGDENSA